MRIFKVKLFARYANEESINDSTLTTAIKNAENGLIDADLGGGLIKMRIAKTGNGKSGGYRTIIAYKKNEKAIFLFGFQKNELGNITKKQLDRFKYASKLWLKASDVDLEKSISIGELEEIS